MLNLIKPRANLEIQENFFLIRVFNNWLVWLVYTGEDKNGEKPETVQEAVQNLQEQTWGRVRKPGGEQDWMYYPTKEAMVFNTGLDGPPRPFCK